MSIAKEKVVSFHYTLTDEKGTVIDQSSEQEGPLSYIHGLGHIIPGLEKELEGKVVGDKLKVSVEPKEAYGERQDQLIQSVPKTEFQDAETVQVGSQFQVDTEHGPMILTVIEITEGEFVLDGNHPLAGMKLHFDVEVMELRDATKEELDHGHVHGPGGVQHD